VSTSITSANDLYAGLRLHTDGALSQLDGDAEPDEDHREGRADGRGCEPCRRHTRRLRPYSLQPVSSSGSVPSRLAQKSKGCTRYSGGRQLDGTLGSAEVRVSAPNRPNASLSLGSSHAQVIEEVVAAVRETKSDCEVYVDGGV